MLKFLDEISTIEWAHAYQTSVFNMYYIVYLVYQNAQIVYHEYTINIFIEFSAKEIRKGKVTKEEEERNPPLCKDAQSKLSLSDAGLKIHRFFFS